MWRVAESTTQILWRASSLLTLSLCWASLWLLGSSLAAPEALAQSGVASAQARTAQYIFVIDDSGSMSKKTSGGPAADPDRLSVFAVRSLLSMLDDADEATVVRLNGPDAGEPIEPIAPLAQNRATLRQKLSLDGTLAEYGGQRTPCRTALQALSKELSRAWRPEVAQVVFFLTDGECTGRPPSPAAFLSGVDAHDDRLFKFYMLRFEGRAYSQSLVDLARRTDGDAVVVSAQDPTTILKPFASALSNSQGYDSYLLTPDDPRLAAHAGARRIRLLAVAPDQGTSLSFQIAPASKGKAPVALAAPETGVHQYADGRRYRYAALDYRPGDTPVTIGVEGAGDAWKVVAVPEYKLFVDVALHKGRCGTSEEDVQFVEVGAEVCVTASLVNEQSEVVTGAVSGRNASATVRYKAPGAKTFADLPGNRLGDEPVFTLERVNLTRGDHIFRPVVAITPPGSSESTITLRGAPRTLQVSSRSITPSPARFDFGEVVPGEEHYSELTLAGNFPPTMGRLVAEGEQSVPECVSFELSGVAQGDAQQITPNQTYSLAVKIAPYCGHSSFTRDVNAALRLEFDRAASSRSVPSVVLPVTFSLVHTLGLPSELDAALTGGEDAELALELTGNHKKPIVFEAILPPPTERAGWPDEDLTLMFLDEEGQRLGALEDPALSRSVSFAAAGGSMAPLRIKAFSDACCAGGTYQTELALVPISGADETIRIPIKVTVTDAGVWSCWGPVILWGVLALVMLALALYVFNMFRQSNLLSRDLMASRLVPLRWDEWGEPETQSRQADDVKRLVRRCMPWHRRALNWLKANPLKFGLPGEAYYETVQLFLEPARDVSRSRVTLVPERDLYQELRREPQRGKGRIYCCARGGLYFFAIPGRDGRLGRLRYNDEFGGFDDAGWGDEEGGEGLEVQRLRRDELLTIDDEREPDTAAGWRVG